MSKKESKVTEKFHQWPNGDKFQGRMLIDGYGRGPDFDQPLAGTFVTAYTGDTHVGTFLDGKRHGNGKLTFANGDVFEGCFYKGGVCGKGTFSVAATGTAFKGIFGRRRRAKDPPPEILTDTMLYRGLTNCAGLMPLDLTPIKRSTAEAAAAMADDVEEEGAATALLGEPLDVVYTHKEILTGNGDISFPDGRIYTGRFEEGKPTTDGGMLWIPVKAHVDDNPEEQLSDTYTGEMIGQGVPHGRGRIEYARGGHVVGSFYNGVPHGRSCHVVEASGDEYEGALQAGARTGFGKLTRSNGDVYEGMFDVGVFEGRGRYTSISERSVFEGFFHKGQREGRGRLISEMGMFDGFWKEGKRSGLGVSHSLSGERQEAWYCDDSLSGTPRIFFQQRALPGLIANRVAGATLKAFVASAPAAGATVDHVVSLNLRIVPRWLAKKRHAPTPSHDAPPICADVGADDEGRVHLRLTIRPPPPAAMARAHLEVSMEPPKHAYLAAGTQESKAPPFDMPSRVPRVRLQLFSCCVEKVVTNADHCDGAKLPSAPAVSCAASLLVTPMLEWCRPSPGPGGVGGDEVELA